jgi:hypothetical protein
MSVTLTSNELKKILLFLPPPEKYDFEDFTKTVTNQLVEYYFLDSEPSEDCQASFTFLIEKYQSEVVILAAIIEPNSKMEIKYTTNRIKAREIWKFLVIYGFESFREIP